MSVCLIDFESFKPKEILTIIKKNNADRQKVNPRQGFAYFKN